MVSVKDVLDEFDAERADVQAYETERGIERLEDDGMHFDQNSTIIEMLANGATLAAAGKPAGLSPRTVRRRMQDPAFREKVMLRRSELTQRRMAEINNLHELALLRLREALDSPSENVRLSAAKATINLHFKMPGLVRELERHLTASSDRTGVGADLGALPTGEEPRHPAVLEEVEGEAGVA